ncbi:transcription-repair coupling factor (superfamily II helicase) [Loktanella sp. DSM 29012]|nr:transcription-repair coupling factor (superfamily II helicase) [Loktanella sp. DSM 29012]
MAWRALAVERAKRADMTNRKLTDRDHDLLFGDDKLEPGDAVVHFEHGLARYGGQFETDLGDTQQTLTTFVYRHDGKMMLPARVGHDFWPYGAPAENLTLDRLNSDDWVKRRDEMIVELRQSAENMVAADQARRRAQASSVAVPNGMLDDFVAAFPHEMTVDQIRATDAVFADLQRTTPMNRMLVGDVGFGKTEVALRAAAAAALTGHQVVIAAPTTVLARQHFETFAQRFHETDITVAELSRLTDPAQRQELLSGLASGDVGIVVGTQALLDDAIAFTHLGLLIIDEEQRFGEDDKAQLRDLTDGLHVLSMTATPIPRTLATAEVGLIDVSVLATAPQNRQPVETQVQACDVDRMLAAIATETARGGQCYIVCPRISDVEELDAAFTDRDAAFSHVVAHGQMADADMAETMFSFMSGQVDVLISTTIVESGLDNARANTMVVWDADRFGLAQLHQLRGRIGRSHVQARMLLMTAIDRQDDSDANVRLSAFAEMTEIGAGFRIARKDRDIRGFGNLDGTEQSGQMSRLGIGLYRHILKNHIDRIAS